MEPSVQITTFCRSSGERAGPGEKEGGQNERME